MQFSSHLQWSISSLSIALLISFWSISCQFSTCLSETRKSEMAVRDGRRFETRVKTLKLLAYSPDHVTSYIKDSKKELLRRGGFIAVILINIRGVMDIFY